jgi:arylsulfatase A-like enzyme
MHGRRRCTHALCCAAVLSALVQVHVSETARAAGSVERRPNIFLVVTDDQREGTLSAMPKTRALARAGRRFIRTFVATPLCCPSRATIMTGLYPHNHDVHNNEEARRLDQGLTVQRFLRDAGYATALAGKFLNRLPVDENPSHFDKWAVMFPGYYDTRFNVNGRVRTVTRYSTDFISDKAVGFLRSFDRHRDLDPWYVMVTPYAPHLPATPEREHTEAPVPGWSRNPANTEQNRADKPPWVRAEHTSLDRIQDVRNRQFRTLRSVDEMMGRISRLLRRLGENRRTLVIFTSDNGFLWREHGLRKKSHPYENSVRVPLFVRWPGHVSPGTRDSRFASLVDVAPTIFDAAQVDDVQTDGSSLLRERRRKRVYMEYWKDLHIRNIPGWRALRSSRSLYVEYLQDDRADVVFREYYRLRSDPWEVSNVLRDGNPSNNPSQTRLGRLHDRLVELSTCDSSECP